MKLMETTNLKKSSDTKNWDILEIPDFNTVSHVRS